MTTSAVCLLWLCAFEAPDPILWVSVQGDSKGIYSALHFRHGIRRLEGVTVGEWVAAWKGFPASDGTRVWLIDRYGQRQELGSLPAPGSDRWSFSPNGKFLFESSLSIDDESLVVRGRDGKVVVDINRAGLAERLGAKRSFPSSMEGLAWAPSSRTVAFATGVGGSADSSGVAGPRVVLLDVHSKKLRSLGTGAPLAWINDDELLVGSNFGTRGEFNEVWVLARNGTRSRKISGVVSGGFDGQHIVLFRPSSGGVVRELWSKRLDVRISKAAFVRSSAEVVPYRVCVPRVVD